MFVTVEIPDRLSARFEAACDHIRATLAEGDDRHPEDVIAEWGMQHAEALMQADTEGAANQAPTLLDAAEAAAAVLAKGKWLKGSTDPEAVALYKLLDAIALAKAPLVAD